MNLKRQQVKIYVIVCGLLMHSSYGYEAQEADQYDLLLALKNQRIEMMRDFAIWQIVIFSLIMILGVFFVNGIKKTTAKEIKKVQDQLADHKKAIERLGKKERKLMKQLHKEKLKNKQLELDHYKEKFQIQVQNLENQIHSIKLSKGTQIDKNNEVDKLQIRDEVKHYLNRSRILANHIQDRCLQSGNHKDKSKLISCMLKTTMYASKDSASYNRETYWQVKHNYDQIQEVFNHYNPGYEVVNEFTDISELA